MRRLVSRTGRALLGSVVIAVLALACAPSCEEVCRKARTCDLSPRLSQDECVEACDRQKTFYEVEDDKEGQKAYADERQCIAASTCEEIEAGACYDPELFPF